MAYTITYNERYKLVELRFNGSALLNEHVRSRSEAIDLCKESNTDRLLVDLGDLRAQETLSKRDLMEFSESWGDSALHNLFLGVVMPEDIESQNEFYFALHISKMSGLTLKAFNKDRQAISWLVSED